MSELPLDTEQQLIERIRSIDVAAPAQLHERVAGLVADSASRRGGLPATPRLLAPAAAVVAAAAVVLVLALSGGGGGTAPQLSAASALALGRSTMGAPPKSRVDRRELAAAVDGVSFPYWDRLGWHAVGARTDTVEGRSVMTVFYGNARGQRIGYAIVSGTPAARISGGSVRLRAGTPYRLLRLHGAGTVAWLREGRLCVVSGRGVDYATLVRLASWNEHGSEAA